MLTKYLKQAPTMIVVGVTGFAAWPVLFPEGEPASAKGTSKPPEAARPSASIADLDRNPFQLKRAPAVAPASKASPAVLASAAAAAKAAKLPELSAEDDKVIAELRLGGTFVDGREQLALIDNKIYARGDSLRAADGSPMPYVVAEVRKDRAVLRRGRRNFLLGFSNTPRPALAKAEAPKAPDPTKPPARAEMAAKADPAARGKSPDPARPRGDSGAAKEMIMRLLSGFGGSPAGGPTASGSGSTASGPLDGLASGVGINASSISAGIDALMGKLDNIGRDGAAPPTAGDGGTTP